MPVQLDPVLLDVLACPAEHHAPLTVGTPSDPDASALTCTECGRRFPVRDGIPVLLLDEAFYDDAQAAAASKAPLPDSAKAERGAPAVKGDGAADGAGLAQATGGTAR